jgi:phage terminase Nu1 subunit (DNA packaging protein)
MKPAKKTDEPLQNLSIEAASKLIGADRRVVTKAIEGAVEIEPTGYHGGHARYALRDVVAALIDYKVAAIRNQNGNAEPDELERQRIRLTRAKADVAEIDANLRRGTSLDAAATEKVMGDMILTARSRFLNMPRKLAPQLAQANAAEAERILEREIRAALQELAGFDAGKVYEEYLDRQRMEAAPGDNPAIED